MLTLTLLIGTLDLSFEVQRVEASGTIYIRADGSIDPPTAPISTIDNITYSSTGNINDSIIIERDNIVVDGARYTVTGNGYSGNGITLTDRNNVTVRNMTIKNFYIGTYLYSSSNNVLSGNSVTNNSYGILLVSSSNNVLSGNNVTANNGNGIYLLTPSYLLTSSDNNTLSDNNIANNNAAIELDSSDDNVLSGNNITNSGISVELVSSSGNSIYHNNFINNTQQALTSEGYTNSWNESYPSGGNCWSDCNGTDANHDGIGDTPYIIDANNTDNYPLMVPYTIPEFPAFLILPLFFIATLLAVIVQRRKHPRAR
jgi:parallel beta-helix repeat protein